MATAFSATKSYRVLEVNADTTIQQLVEEAGLTYVKGKGYYQVQSVLPFFQW